MYYFQQLLLKIGEELPNEFVLKYIINKNHIFNLNRINFIYEFDRLEYNNNDDKILEKIKNTTRIFTNN